MSKSCDLWFDLAKKAWDTFYKKYPEFIKYFLNIVGEACTEFQYSVSTLQDVHQLQEILRDLEEELEGVKVVYPKWERTRKDTIDRLIIYADELDVHRKNTNIAMLTGSLAGFVGGAIGIASLLTAIPTGGASLGLSVAGGAVSTGGSMTFMGINTAIECKVKDCVDQDEKLTRELAQEMKSLDDTVGRLGRWINGRQLRLNPYIYISWDSAVSTIFKAATMGTKCTKDIAQTGSIAVRNTAIAFMGIGMILDVALIGIVSYDIDKGSKTKTGKHLKELSKKLEKELTEMRSIYQKIEIETNLRKMQREHEAERREMQRKHDAEIARLEAELRFLREK